MVDKIPILLIVFNRPLKTRSVFEAIRKYQPRQLFIAADGHRPHRLNEAQLCDDTKKVFESIDWECQVHTLFQKKNLGCKIGVSSAISWFFEHVEMGIILEDDCLPSQSFFSYASSCLYRYKEQCNVWMISGNNFHNKPHRVQNGYYFTRLPHIWGWATWRRAWQLYDIEMRDLCAYLKNGRIIEISSNKDIQFYWSSNFIKTYYGEIDTWDYQWVFSIFKNQGLCLCPTSNLVQNIGFGDDSTHTKSDPMNLALLEAHETIISTHTTDVAVNTIADEEEYRLMGITHNGLWTSPLKWRKLIRRRIKARRLLKSFLSKHDI